MRPHRLIPPSSREQKAKHGPQLEQMILANYEYRFPFLEYTVILGKKPVLAMRIADERLGLAAHTRPIIALNALTP